MTAGCREAPTTVSGSVMLDGKPLVTSAGTRGTVVFQPARGGAVLNGLIGRDGTYRMAVGSTDLVKPGRYTVSVSAVEIVPAADADSQPTSRRITPARYASVTESGLWADVAHGPNDIDLYLSSDTKADDNPSADSNAERDAAAQQPRPALRASNQAQSEKHEQVSL